MIYEDLKEGDVFAIQGSKSYPKLKLKGSSYVDMRDEILNKSGDTVKGRQVEIMTAKDIADNATWGDETELSALDFVLQVKKKYLAT